MLIVSQSDITNAVILKPDALHGPTAAVEPSYAADFLACLANHCVSNPSVSLLVQHEESLTRAQRARDQVSERTASDKGFEAEILQREDCSRRLLMNVESVLLESEQISVAALIAGTVEALGFEVVTIKQWELTFFDVVGIYQGAVGQQTDVMKGLLHYLEGQQVSVLLLAGAQARGALQVLKTYLRYFFVYSIEERHSLMNMIHVCEDDLAFVVRALFSLD